MTKIKNRPKGWVLIKPGQGIKGEMRALFKENNDWTQGRDLGVNWTGDAKAEKDDVNYYFRKVTSK